jgi:hypothetical protein
MMALVHRVEGTDDVPREPSIWLKIQQFLAIMPQRFKDAEKQARYQQFSFGLTYVELSINVIPLYVTSARHAAILLIFEILYSSCDCKIMLLMLFVIFVSNGAIVVPTAKFIVHDHPVNAA